MTADSVVAGSGTARRRARERYRALPWAAQLVLRIALGLVLLALAALFANSYQASVISTALIYGIAAIALTVLMGWVGRPSIMTASNLLAGSYLAVFFGNRLHLTFVLVLVLCLIGGAIFGVMAALPARRLTGIYLLLSTLAIYYLVTDLGNIYQSHDGVLAGYFPKPARLFGSVITSSTSWMWIAGVITIIVLEYFRYLRTTRIGRAWILVRDTEEAAGVAGVRLSSYVTIGFSVTTAVQFLAGGLLAYQVGNVSYSSVSLQLSVNFIVMIVLGRMGSLIGAVVGAIIVTSLPVFMDTWFGASSSSSWLGRNLVPLESVVFAIVGIAVLLNLPGAIRHLLRSFSSRRGSSTTDADSAAIDEGVALRLHEVSAQYGAGEQAVSHASLDLPESGVVALLGRNGAGKTSLLYAAAGFPPGTRGRLTKGRVMLRPAGQSPIDITRLGIAERNRLGIVLVPAEDKVFIDLTVREHLREALASGAHRRKKNGGDAVDLDGLLAVFPDLASKMDRSAGHLSGGERQQLALAMARARGASVLLIDEATLGLAPIAVRAIEPVLRELGGNPGHSLVLAEQNPTLAARVSGLVVLLDAGQIVRSGVPDEAFLREVELNYLGVGAGIDSGEIDEANEAAVRGKD